MADAIYIPDHIRFQRTDRLYHIHASLVLTGQRLARTMWQSAEDHAAVGRIHTELILIGAELHKRELRTKKELRSMRQAAYITDRS